MKLFLDDVRHAPEGFMRAFRPAELSLFLYLARHAKVISMDHDLGLDPDGKEFPNGNDILKMFEKEVYEGTLWGNGAPQILIHSANPVGRKNMEDTINSIINLLTVRTERDNMLAELQRLRNIEAEARHLCENADFSQCDGLEGIFNVTVSDMNALKDALTEKRVEK